MSIGRTEPISAPARAALAELRAQRAGDVRDDNLHRALYATDASIYQMVPDGVVLPRRVEDVQAAVCACARHGVPLTARGAGTGLAGGAVNRGLQLDLSRHMNRILAIDPAARTVVVEPGVVLDDLNAAVRPHGLQFAPDVATSSRATLGGMIANNSCGAHSVMYGRTVDHVLAVDVVLSDGSRHAWGEAAFARGGPTRGGAGPPADSLAARCEAVLRTVAVEYAGEIRSRFPRILRSNGGYALDRLRTDRERVNAETVICGSEGTLAIVVGAVLRLVPLPRHRGLVVAHFDDLLDALAATPAALEHTPAAVELLDKLILDAARASRAMAGRMQVIEGDPRGVLVIELCDEDERALDRRLRGLVEDLRGRGMGRAWPVLEDPGGQADVWNVRKAGLGLLMSRPGQRQPYDFVDDTAVDPARLRDYIARFMQVLAEEGVEEASYYAHASVGCLHVKPVLNLRRLADVRRMYRVAERISALAVEFGGTVTGEHGDGLVRSCWLERLYGPRIIEAFGRVKRAFDPGNLLNPGKIVDPPPMTGNLRWRPVEDPPAGASSPVGLRPEASSLTVLDFSRHGGMAGLAEMCSGVGQCRQRRVGVMCPSYMATGDERHTTRARANALRLALNDGSLIRGLDDPALEEVMDLCLSCKACRNECPTGVDMARLKAEWQHHRHRRRGAPLRSRMVGSLPMLCEAIAPVAPLANLLLRSRPARRLAEIVAGMDRRVPPPLFARRTFRDWLASGGDGPPRAGRGEAPPAAGRQVVLFVDTWTNYFAPQVGIAAVRVLRALGLDVVVPEHACCGRPAISQGLLDDARDLAGRNVRALSPFAAAGLPIVGLEPSCLSTLVDELPQLVRTEGARQVAGASMMIEALLARWWREGGRECSRRAGRERTRLLYHGHCHQKALFGTADALEALRAIADTHEIDSGCCGMAGAFGHEKEHYDVARAIGEERLFPAVRARGTAEIVASGFSCRQQIEHHTGARARHPIEVIAGALDVAGGGDG